MFCIRDNIHKTKEESENCSINPNCEMCNFSHGISNMIDTLKGKNWLEKDVRKLFIIILDTFPVDKAKRDMISDIIKAKF